MKFIFIFLTLIVLTTANELSLKIQKETNGGYLLSLPALEFEEQEGLFLRKTNLELLFTSPRGDLGIPNHYAVKFDNHFGITYEDFFCTFSLDLLYKFEENSKKEEPGLEFGNTLTIGFKF